MGSFEFGATAPVTEPVVDWDEVFTSPPTSEPDPEPDPCTRGCCAPQLEGGLL
jgi:hypothetical protein